MRKDVLEMEGSSSISEVITFTDDFIAERCYFVQSDAESDAWGASCDALVIISGTTNDDEIRFPKSSALQVGMSLRINITVMSS